MSRGTTIKTDTAERLTLLRPMITRRYQLMLERERCCGCDTCATVCPQEAISLARAELSEGRMVAKPAPDIDAARCNYCGACAVMCPTQAITLTVNDQVELPVLKGEAFPRLIKGNVVNQEVCRASTDVSYAERCPTGAIEVVAERDAQGAVQRVERVSVDEGRCVYCGQCMVEGPAGAFTVTSPHQGRALLNTLLCPAGCQACYDVCPTNAIAWDGQKVSLNARYCLFCGACEEVCPVEGAVRIARTGYRHEPVESGAWRNALEKLVSLREAIRELDVKGQQKRRKLVIGALLLDASDGED